MIGPVARLLPDGKRLHLQHGPIDLVISCNSFARTAAFDAAEARFKTLLEELVAELPLLRQNRGPRPQGAVARRMYEACAGHKKFVTPMAAVAGAVAEAVLAAMRKAAPLTRAAVNNGGDIALHLEGAETFRLAMASLANTDLGRIEILADQGVGGIATSGFGGRSLTRGIATSVTVLAARAPEADMAATLIANEVDLPGHPGIFRLPADEVQPDSDLGALLVTRFVPLLSPQEIATALDRGKTCAEDFRRRGIIRAAALFLQGESRVIGSLAPAESFLSHV